MDSAKEIRVCGYGFENYRTLLLFAVRKNHIDAINAEGIALSAFRASSSAAFRRRLIFLALAFFEGLEIVENVMAHFFQILGNLLVGILFFQLFNYSVDEHRRRFLI